MEELPFRCGSALRGRTASAQVETTAERFPAESSAAPPVEVTMTTIPAPPRPRHRIDAVPATVAPRPETGSDDVDERVECLEREVAQLRTAMASRAVIEQAKGILMLLTGCTDQVAFDLLTHISSTTHRKVRDLAMAITDSACGRSPLPVDVQDAIRDVCPPPHAVPQH